MKKAYMAYIVLVLFAVGMLFWVGCVDIDEALPHYKHHKMEDPK